MPTTMESLGGHAIWRTAVVPLSVGPAVTRVSFWQAGSRADEERDETFPTNASAAQVDSSWGSPTPTRRPYLLRGTL